MSKKISETYTISEETFYDEDKELYGTYIGLDDDNQTLIFTSWGKTAKESKYQAYYLVEMLDRI